MKLLRKEVAIAWDCVLRILHNICRQEEVSGKSYDYVVIKAFFMCCKKDNLPAKYSMRNVRNEEATQCQYSPLQLLQDGQEECSRAGILFCLLLLYSQQLLYLVGFNQKNDSSALKTKRNEFANQKKRGIILYLLLKKFNLSSAFIKLLDLLMGFFFPKRLQNMEKDTKEKPRQRI